MRVYYQEQMNFTSAGGVLYYSGSTKHYSKWREVARGQTVSATFTPSSSCNMVVRYVNFYIKDGSACQIDIQIIRGPNMETWHRVSYCRTKNNSCLRWHVLDTLSSDLREQCPTPSQVKVFIKPLLTRGTVRQCHISANRYNLPIIRLFMEYTTDEETPTLASTGTIRGPVPTRFKANPTTSRKVLTTSGYGSLATSYIPNRSTMDLNTTKSTIEALSAHSTTDEEMVLTTLNAKSDFSEFRISSSGNSNNTGSSNRPTSLPQRDDSDPNVPSTQTRTTLRDSRGQSSLSQDAIVGISLSIIASGLLLAALVLRRYRSPRRKTESRTSPKVANAEHSDLVDCPDGTGTSTQEIAIYETVPNDASKCSEQSGAMMGNNQSIVPMYESTAYVSITKKSCDLTGNSAYGTNSDTK
ncbi:uncharacterized protein LOC135812525 [Sycon ciliatum]|uniref:uncharacterized protein LOC135812525 n=1 Tax=Sycon ciliatum TaxID=27933 RepID=UPI0031F66E73